MFAVACITSKSVSLTLLAFRLEEATPEYQTVPFPVVAPARHGISADQIVSARIASVAHHHHAAFRPKIVRSRGLSVTAPPVLVLAAETIVSTISSARRSQVVSRAHVFAM